MRKTMPLMVGLVLMGPAVVARPIDGATRLDRGIGPIKQVQLGPIDAGLVAKGRQVFEQKCTPCHKFDERYVGPALGGVTKRRAPEWIMNMILNPQGMLEKDPTAQALLGEYMTPMTFQNVTEADARAILEYVRSVDQPKGEKRKDDKKKEAKTK